MNQILLILLYFSSVLSFHKSIEQVQKLEKVEFSIKKALTTVKGTFKIVDYSIKINENDTGNIRGTAEIESVYTGNSTRDKHLQAKEWFYSEKFPQIIIQSKSLSRLNENEFLGLFDITIRGLTQTFEIPFKINTINNQKYLQSSFKLSIDSFKIGGGIISFLVADQVNISLNLPF